MSTEIFRENIGAGDGVTVIFQLINTPDAGSEMIFLNELYQESGVHYTIAGKIITFTIPPVAGARLRAWYWTAGGSSGGGSSPATTGDDETVEDLVTDALIEIGAIAAGETPGASDSDFVMRKLNRMLGQWNLREVMAYTTRVDRYTLTPVGQASYSIGRSGSATFAADRPVRIVRANMVLTNTSPQVRVPLAIIDDREWADIRVTNISVTIPRALYPDGNYPDLNLFFWPRPSAAYDVELFTWQQLSRFVALTDVVSAPPGYKEAMTLTLAEKICSAFGKSRPPELEEDARKARAAVISSNSALPRMQIDSPGMGDTGRFNFRTGQTG